MKYTLIAILAISSTIYAAPVAVCGGSTSTWCLACSGTACTTCAKGFPTASGTDVGKCKVQATPVAGCAVALSDTECSRCEAGKMLSSATSCTTPTAITDCYSYRAEGTALTPTCTSCNAGKFPSGTNKTSYTTTGGITTLFGCQASTPGAQALIGNCANHYAKQVQDVSTNIAADYTIACKWCNAGYYLSADNLTCTAQGTDRVGCSQGTSTTCSICFSSHQMQEANVCTAAPGAKYSAILSVVSMIVALMFANF